MATTCSQRVARVRTFLDALTNWYVRRSRERFWAGDDEALDVLWTVLTTLCQVAAPLLPLTTEAVYRGLVGDDSSVHLTDWPASTDWSTRRQLVTAMDRVRDVCSASSAVRKATGRRVRQPLSKLTIAAHDAESLEPFRGIIADEINVKEVVLSTDLDAVGAVRADGRAERARTARRQGRAEGDRCRQARTSGPRTRPPVSSRPAGSSWPKASTRCASSPPIHRGRRRCRRTPASSCSTSISPPSSRPKVSPVIWSGSCNRHVAMPVSTSAIASPCVSASPTRSAVRSNRSVR